MPGTGLEECAFGHETDDLAPGGSDAVCLRLQPHRLVGAVQGSALEIDEVHRDLRLTLHFQA
jgi:hypothetical protein